MLIVDRRGRAGEIVNLADLDIERKSHVVARMTSKAGSPSSDSMVR
jgi:hypothetical protein